MYIVHVFNKDFESWDYQCTLHGDHEIMYSLIQLFEEVELRVDQSELLERLINNKRYVGRYLRIFYIGSPELDWDLFNE